EDDERAEQKQQQQARAPRRYLHGKQRIRVKRQSLAASAVCARGAHTEHAAQSWGLLHGLAPRSPAPVAGKNTVSFASMGFKPSRRAAVSTAAGWALRACSTRNRLPSSSSAAKRRCAHSSSTKSVRVLYCAVTRP